MNKCLAAWGADPPVVGNPTVHPPGALAVAWLHVLIGTTDAVARVQAPSLRSHGLAAVRTNEGCCGLPARRVAGRHRPGSICR